MSFKNKGAYQQLQDQESHSVPDDLSLNPGTTRWSKRKKILVWGGLSLIIVLAVVLVLVFTLTGDKDGDTPIPPPPPPKNRVVTQDLFYVDTIQSALPYNYTFLMYNRIDRSDREDTQYMPAVDLPPNTVQDLQASTLQGRVLLNNPNNIRLTFTNIRNSSSSNANQPISDQGIPQEFFNTQAYFDLIKPSISLADAGFNITTNPFSINIDHPKFGKIFDTAGHFLHVYDKYIEFGWNFMTNKTFGLGQRVHNFLLNDGEYAMWNNPRTQAYDNGTNVGNLYGTHPFYLNSFSNGFIGVYVANPYGQTGKVNGTSINHKSIGGNLDLWIWYGETAQSVLQQYHGLIGKPFLPPLWSLGVHQSRFGYKTLKELQSVVTTYAQLNLPLDAIWSDLDYMGENRQDFRVDQSDNYNQIAGAVYLWKQSNINWVPILEPAIPVNKTQMYYQNLTALSGAVISNYTKDHLIGSNWDHPCVFFDYWSAGGQKVWNFGLGQFYKDVLFAGLWLDLNQVENQCPGECPNPDYAGHDNVYKRIPFKPGSRQLDLQAISLDAMHTDASRNNMTRYNYDLHNMWGIKQVQVTFQHLTNNTSAFFTDNNRPFILSRSTFPGIGQYAAHWTGDNHSTWQFLRQSIPSIFNFNMFGVPLVGADVCGFLGDTTDDLCSRWYQVSVAYPFMRNHNVNDSISQEPWMFPKTNLTLYAARGAIAQRYSWMKALYNLFLNVHSDGGAVAMPTYFNFVEDALLLNNRTDQTIMWSNQLLFVPVLEEGLTYTSQFDAYLPSNTVWYNATNYPAFTQIPKNGDTKLYATYNYTNAFINGGTVITYQNVADDVNNGNIKTVKDLVSRPVDLIIAPDMNKQAKGDLISDDGYNTHLPIDVKDYSVNYNGHTITVIVNEGYTGPTTNYLGWQTAMNIRVLGAAKDFTDPSKLFVCAKYINMTRADLKIAADGDNIVISHTKDNQAMDYISMRYISFGEQGGSDLNPCKTQVKASQPVIIQGGAVQQVSLDISGKTEQRKLRENKKTVIPATNPSKLLFQAALYNRTLNTPNSANTIYRINITDSQNERFTVPYSTQGSKLTLSNEKLADHGFKYTQNATYYAFSIVDPKNPDTVYLTSQEQLLVFEDRFIEFDLRIASNGKFWGSGDRAPEQFFLKSGVYTSWARDIPTPLERGYPPGNNMYGVHPIIFTRLLDRRWMAVFINNANAQDWVLDYDDQQGTNMIPLYSKYITIGGVIDMYVIIGDKISEVMKSYHQIIGTPVLVPMYAFGYNQCRWGYTSLGDLQNVYNQAKQNNFPLDGLWTDIDYMKDYADFTVDDARYQGLQSFILDTLNKNGVQFIPIIDAGISTKDSADNPTYARGQKLDAYIYSGYTNEYLIGQVWPGKAVYVNLYDKDTGVKFWKDEFSSFYSSKVAFGGIWLDMNEASNFCNGECPIGMKNQNTDPIDLYGLIYEPGDRSLIEKSMSLNAKNKKDLDEAHQHETQYNFHSLYGFLQMKATSEWFTENNKRPYIISRSTFAGAGKYGSHWLGDNFARWDYMRESIIEIMYFNMYGIPLVGSDICGFQQDTTEQLCNRWMQLGAFYPFMRNHNTYNTISQQPWAMGQSHLQISLAATILRYVFIKYIYTEYWQVSKMGGTLFHPLFFVWEDDYKLYDKPGNNFMLGNAIYVTPVLEKGAKTVKIYFPQPGYWVNHGDGGDTLNLQSSMELTLDVNDSSLFVYQRPGTIVPLQDITRIDPDGTRYLSTQQMKNLQTGFSIALDQTLKASGRVVIDDGVSLLDSADPNYWEINVSYENRMMNFTVADGAKYKHTDKDGELWFIYLHGFGTEQPGKITLDFQESLAKPSVELNGVLDVDNETLFVSWDRNDPKYQFKFNEVLGISFTEKMG